MVFHLLKMYIPQYKYMNFVYSSYVEMSVIMLIFCRAYAKENGVGGGGGEERVNTVMLNSSTAVTGVTQAITK